MNTEYLNNLLEKYLSNSLSAVEEEALSTLLKDDSEREKFNTLIIKKMQTSSPGSPVMSESWLDIPNRILTIDKSSLPQKPARSIYLLKAIAAAAVLIGILFGGYYIFQRNDPSPGNDLLVNAVKTISTTRGQNLGAVLLPDGSRVLLNAESSISYDSAFRKRLVKLKGQAFFNVQHQENNSFTVIAGQLNATVMGTSFDMMAYPDRQAMTIAVRTGKVQVQNNNSAPVVLERGTVLRATYAGTSIEQHTDTSVIGAWTEGRLIYKNEKMGDVITDIARVFDAKIDIAKDTLKEEEIVVSFDKNKGLSAALNTICKITGSRLSQKNGIYTIE